MDTKTNSEEASLQQERARDGHDLLELEYKSSSDEIRLRTDFNRRIVQFQATFLTPIIVGLAALAGILVKYNNASSIIAIVIQIGSPVLMLVACALIYEIRSNNAYIIWRAKYMHMIFQRLTPDDSKSLNWETFVSRERNFSLKWCNRNIFVFEGPLTLNVVLLSLSFTANVTSILISYIEVISILSILFSIVSFLLVVYLIIVSAYDRRCLNDIVSSWERDRLLSAGSASL